MLNNLGSSTGDEFYKLSDTGIEDGYPRKISNFDGLPSNLDAAFTWTNDRTYFFKVNHFEKLGVGKFATFL